MLLLWLVLSGNPQAPVERSPAPAAFEAAYEAEDVPLYTPEDAWRLAHAPESHMIDATTCERVEGAFLPDASGQRLIVSGGHTALFREGRRGTPFLRVRTRQDGVYVARFPARPGERIEARGYILEPRTRRFIYGEPTYAVCRPSRVEVGEVVPATP